VFWQTLHPAALYIQQPYASHGSKIRFKEYFSKTTDKLCCLHIIYYMRRTTTNKTTLSIIISHTLTNSTESPWYAAQCFSPLLRIFPSQYFQYHFDSVNTSISVTITITILYFRYHYSITCNTYVAK
jgi:hypothetical protein